MAFTDKVYTVDWNKLVAWLLPAPLRLPKLMAFATAMVAPVADLYFRFVAYKTYTVYWLGINSQVCYMQKALNDRYDNTLRRIRITDAIAYEGLPLFLQIENKPGKLYLKSEALPKVLYTKGETALFTVDFLVKVPKTVVFNKTEMMALINTFKTPSKTYQIILV